MDKRDDSQKTIHKTYFMNPYTGSVDTAENWKEEGFTLDNADLIEVKYTKGEWIEAD